MTPSRIGLIAVMLVGVRPSISFASLPTASICALAVLKATIDGSLSTMPRPRANTHVFAVPRSIARSFEKTANAPSSTRPPFFVVGGELLSNAVIGRKVLGFTGREKPEHQPMELVTNAEIE